MVPRGIVLVLLTGSLAGCVASHEPAGEPVALPRFCAAFFDALCEPLARCECGDVAVARCRAEERALCRGFPSPAMVSAIDAGRLPYDGHAARALLDAMASRGATCASFAEAIDWRVRDLLSVGGVFEGTVGAGEPCAVLGFELISECALGSCTAIDGAYVCRTAVGPGERCDATHQCADLDAPLTVELGVEGLSLRCRAGVCRARTAEGVACTIDADCESDLCEGSVCRSRALDEGCLSSRECESGHCSAATRTCRPGDAPVGASCDEPAECASRVCVAGACLPAGCETF